MRDDRGLTDLRERERGNGGTGQGTPFGFFWGLSLRDFAVGFDQLVAGGSVQIPELPIGIAVTLAIK